MTTKKVTIAAAIVAAVGISAYLGFRPATGSELSELQLAKAEALIDKEIDLGEVTITCGQDGGRCWKKSKIGYDDDNNRFHTCTFTVVQTDNC